MSCVSACAHLRQPCSRRFRKVANGCNEVKAHNTNVEVKMERMRVELDARNALVAELEARDGE